MNYLNLHEALAFYQDHGFKLTEVPWIVSPKAMSSTTPHGRDGVECGDNFLLGSGEQGFVQMMLDDQIKKGKYVCCTPCFRDEEEFTELTRLHFMKVELIEVDPEPGLAPVLNMLSLAHRFMSKTFTPEIQETKEGFDLMEQGVELGSYGRRTWGGFNWIYGTGVAEPRYSIVHNRSQRP